MRLVHRRKKSSLHLPNKSTTIHRINPLQLTEFSFGYPNDIGKFATKRNVMKAYKYRIADRILKRKVLGKGAVLIEGPKWCGKTTTAKQLAKSILDLGDSAVLKQSSQLIELSPKTLLEGETPRLIDEWQALPPIWDSIRSEVDNRAEPSQFILTGSSVLPEANSTIHSGTGRYAYIKMRPMSIYE